MLFFISFLTCEYLIQAAVRIVTLPVVVTEECEPHLYTIHLENKCYKGPVKLIERVKIAHSLLQCVKSVPHYHFKLAYVFLHMAIK